MLRFVTKCISFILFVQCFLGYDQMKDLPDSFQHKTSNLFHKNLKKLFLGRSKDVNKKFQDNICCADGQWEANVYIHVSSTYSFGPNATVYIYYNGSGSVAFDDTRNKSYLSYSLETYSPDLPHRYHLKSTVIKDFTQGVMYEIDKHGKCARESNSAGMEIVCIPDSGKLVSEGMFGGINVSTYQFSSSQFGEEDVTTATVLKNGSYCETVMMSDVTYSDEMPDVLFYDIDVVDLTKGIKDPSIFVLPKSCNSTETPKL